jgi:hypothetical protein
MTKKTAYIVGATPTEYDDERYTFVGGVDPLAVVFDKDRAEQIVRERTLEWIRDLGYDELMAYSDSYGDDSEMGELLRELQGDYDDPQFRSIAALSDEEILRINELLPTNFHYETAPTEE